MLKRRGAPLGAGEQLSTFEQRQGDAGQFASRGVGKARLCQPSVNDVQPVPEGVVGGGRENR